MTYMGPKELNEFWARISDKADPTPRGAKVRLTTEIRYGQGTGIRYIDLSPEQAEALAIQMIGAARVARIKAAEQVALVAQLRQEVGT